MKAIIFHTTGGPEVLQYQDIELGPPGQGEVRVKHAASGLNFIDTYHRTGLYQVNLPSGIGMEASGVVEAVGGGVTALKTGDRVAYGTGPIGAYAEARNVPAAKLIKIPNEIADETAAAMMLKGMTARYLLRATYVVKPGDTIVVHAAAGATGSILCQWGKALGATVIGTAGSPDKLEVARANGCAHAINSRTDDVAKRVREITGGAGVPVVYDGVGQATFMQSLDCLQPRGLLVSFGNASGPVKNVDLGIFAAKGSLYMTRPTLMTYTATEAQLRETAADLVEVVRTGKVKIPVNQHYPLKDAAQAHRDLESRSTTGATVLIP